jgi:ribonucleotide reductase beta subunit family protein with ferritin-like domain
MPGLTVSNEFISRDEALHVEMAVLIYKHIQNKLDAATIYKIVSEAVQMEKEFIIESIPCAMIGMNADLMSQYIEYVADRLVVQLGYEKIYNTANPFVFMELISMENKTNFFEERVSSYSKAGVGRSREDMTFSLDADF